MNTRRGNETLKGNLTVTGVIAGGSIVEGPGAVTASPAEINRLDGVTPGTAAANKALVLDGNKSVDALAVEVLSLGENLTEVTAEPEELNLSDDLPATATFTPAAAAQNVCEVTIQVLDALGEAMARAVMMLVWLCDADTGIGLTGTTASGTVTAKAASGVVFGILTAKKALLVQTLDDGTFILEITDSGKTAFYVCAAPILGGAPSVSDVLAAEDYGAGT